MKIKLLATSSLLISCCGLASAANIMLDFGATPVGASYLTLSPGHIMSPSNLPGTETNWNTIDAAAPRTNLLYSNGDAASGVTLTLGQEAAGGTNKTINFSTPISSINLAGNGGSAPGQQVLTENSGSIYAGSAAGRDGFFGSGTSGTMPSTVGTGQAVGLRLDGLASGSYLIYVMARNTNSNVNSTTNAAPMNIYADTRASSNTFDFSALSLTSQSNATYANTLSTAYNTFINGENYVTLSVSIIAGQSLFIASEGANTLQEARGFLNMVQIVQVPEPTSAILGALGAVALLRRRRR